MDLKQIADTLQIPLTRLLTGRQGPPKLKLIRGGQVDKPKKPE